MAASQLPTVSDGCVVLWIERRTSPTTPTLVPTPREDPGIPTTTGCVKCNHTGREMDTEITRRGEAAVPYGEFPLTPVLGIGVDESGAVREITRTEIVQ